MRTDSQKHLKRRKPLDGGGVLLEESAAKGPLDLAGLFGNTRPVEVEIGCGKGTFLLARAKARPEVNFVGLEYARAYALYCADRFRRAGLENVRMLAADAGAFFKLALGEACVQRVHIYFPDPWPKRKHHRRRLIQPAFIEQVRRVLTAGGLLQIVTDHREYFEQIRRVLAGASGFATIDFPSMTDAAGEITGTNFERKYIAQGRPFYSIARMKISSQ
ncbi:MAG: tRNA (guanosine(46)-N7)-methyltransferase TrmB [Planctomycetaceae bacterium]|nr:tRNA (guanosine(46)-N7)-methyltransferase TrmB [Planctomycetaceae bacterium]